MKKKTNEILYFTFIISISIILAAFINDTNAIDILTILPNILGILFSGIIAALAIILVLLSSTELSIINSLDNGDDYFRDFLKNVKYDMKVVFLGTCISILLYLFLKTEFTFSIIQTLLNNTTYINHHLKMQSLLITGFIVLSISLLAIYEIIMSIFTLCEIRYEASKIKK